MPFSVPGKKGEQSTSEERSQRTNFDTSEIYIASRRPKRLIASQRNGPIPIEEDSGGTKTELLGKLSISSTNIEDRAGGLAGSLALLGYFQRLALVLSSILHRRAKSYIIIDPISHVPRGTFVLAMSFSMRSFRIDNDQVFWVLGLFRGLSTISVFATKIFCEKVRKILTIL